MIPGSIHDRFLGGHNWNYWDNWDSFDLRNSGRGGSVSTKPFGPIVAAWWGLHFMVVSLRKSPNHLTPFQFGESQYIVCPCLSIHIQQDPRSPWWQWATCFADYNHNDHYNDYNVYHDNNYRDDDYHHSWHSDFVESGLCKWTWACLKHLDVWIFECSLSMIQNPFKQAETVRMTHPSNIEYVPPKWTDPNNKLGFLMGFWGVFNIGGKWFIWKCSPW